MITRILGDIHGEYANYLKIIKEDSVSHSIQLGDFGFNYNVLDSVDSAKHRFIGGNHDNYDLATKIPHYLGDYGQKEVGSLKFFFIRGELSVDKQWRKPGISWWEAEELSAKIMDEAIQEFCDTKPEIVLTHGCPSRIIPLVVTNRDKLNFSYTAKALDICFESHKPKLWIFGHHHNNQQHNVDGTEFHCLQELCYLDFDEDGKMISPVHKGTPVNF